MADDRRTAENSGDRLRDIVDMDGLQPRPTHAEQWKDRQGPEETRKRREELVVGCEHDRRPYDRRAGEGLMDDRLAFTAGAAWAEFAEGRRGLIREGFDADLTVFRRDILAVHVDEIPYVPVSATVVGGRVVYAGV